MKWQTIYKFTMSEKVVLTSLMMVSDRIYDLYENSMLSSKYVITYIYLKGYYSNEVGEDGRCAKLCQKSQCHESVQNCQMPLMNKKTTIHQWIVWIFFRINQKIIQQNNEIGTKQCAHRALYRYIMNVCWNTHSYRLSERQTKAPVRE